MNDNEIVDLYFERSEQAIDATQEKYSWYCTSIAYRILASIEDSQESVNDTWLQAWNSIPPKKPKNLQAFLGKITRNIALNRVRAESRQKRGGDTVTFALSELEDCVTNGTTPEDALIHQQTVEAINGFLKTLPQEKRVAFVLRYWYLYSAKEIALKMGLRENTVNSILFRLRKQLKTHLEQEGILL